MSDLYLLDTNGASDLFSGKSLALEHAAYQAVMRKDTLAISVLSHAELRFGFTQRPSVRLEHAYNAFLRRAVVLPWDEQAAASYAELRLQLKRRRLVVDTIDLLIASQARALGATLVTRDKAFRHLAGMVKAVNWATDLN